MSGVAIRGYYLGCPGWGDKNWVGRLFPPGTKHAEFLAHYAQVFNTVEGNTSFYALPTVELVARWRDAVPDDFRFCWKFPKTISHERQLIDCGHLVAEFLDRLAPLGKKLGTLMLQLPPQFDDRHLPRLAAFLAQLPPDRRYAVEYRHATLVDHPAALALLRDRAIDLVMMDARGLHASKSLEHADVRAKKPDLPLAVHATARQPIVRCVPHEQFDVGLAHIAAWADQVASWIGTGKQPYFFMHAPDDTFAPENAYRFHAMLSDRIDAGTLPVWPGSPRQLGLF